MRDEWGVSFVLATRNRRDVLLESLGHIRDCGLDRDRMEVFVVDNASTDGTSEAVARQFPDVHLLALRENRGSCAKDLALAKVRFPYVMFLDDDSWPLGDSVSKMVDRFERTPSLAAAGFMADLVDGRMECSAFPHVFIGCGVGLRTQVLRDVGGIDGWFFMQAEEYDLAFRLVNSGYQVQVFEDLHVRHLKTPKARYGGTTAYYDVRNNVVLAFRYLSEPWLGIYLKDWVQRYAWLSRTGGHGMAFARGLAAGLSKAMRERLIRPRERLSDRAFQAFFRIREIEARMEQLAVEGRRRVLLADLGKNVYAFLQGALVAGLKPVAIADDRFAAAGRRYRGIPILPTEKALRSDIDVIVVSNTSYVHAAERAHALRATTTVPVVDWFGQEGFASCR